MMAGAGVSVGGAGMLRTRRRDVSVKPNRKLDRKSSRGMIYENEELRLRTIHINAEVEQGQNDIKKLRRENEQLRREIWSLRDEYDRLEEILKRQKSCAESEESEDRSDEDDDPPSDCSLEKDDENDNYKGSTEDLTKSEQLENAENQKISSEKMTSSLHRLHVDFDDLSVVDEEEELKKEKKEASSEDGQLSKSPLSILKPRQLHENIPFYPATYDPPSTLSSSSYFSECPFNFPSPMSLIMPSEGPGLVASPISSLPNDPMMSLPSLNADHLDTNVLHPPPVGWQGNILVAHKQMAAYGPPEVAVSSGMQTFAGSSGFSSFPNLVQRRNSGIKQGNTFYNQQMLPPGNPENQAVQNGWSFEDPKAVSEQNLKKKQAEEAVPGAEKPKHFFAPLPAKQKRLTEEPSPTVSQFGTGNSSSSGRTGSTVVSKSQFSEPKGCADVYVNGAVAHGDSVQRNVGEQRTFLSTDNLLITEDRAPQVNNQLTKSMSCQDLSTEASVSHSAAKQQMTQSDNTLDSLSDSKPFKSHLSVTLKTPKTKQPVNPDTPEVPKLPSIDYRLFKNPFLRSFDPSAGFVDQNNVTRPLSVEVNDDNFCYYSPHPEPTATFNRGVHLGERYRHAQADQSRLLIPSNQLLNGKLMSPTSKHEIQVTSFERPSPHTLIGPSTTYEFSTLRRLTPNPYLQSQNLYQNVAYPGRSGIYPQRGRMYYENMALKVPAQTQTSIDGDSQHEEEHALSLGESTPGTPSGQHRRRVKKEKSGVIREQKPVSPVPQRKIKKQSSVTSSEMPESPGKLPRKRSKRLSITTTTTSEGQEDKNESRSSSSGQDSPKKDQTRRVSLYFNTKKRPSLTSVKTARSGSIDISREKDMTTNSERERTNSVSSRDTVKLRKASTSSGNVPWCACWGNGCI